MPERVVIYRACDRPEYMEHTFGRLVRATTPGVPIFVVENSELPVNWEANSEIFHRLADERCFLKVYRERLGITRPIIEGVSWALEDVGRPEHVMVMDDDILVPEPVVAGECWDYALAEMLKGPWDFVGLTYKAGESARGDPVGDGMQRGWSHSFMAACGAGFRYEVYERDPLVDNHGIASFNIWSKKYRCGWFAGYPLYKQEIDKRDALGLGLRDTVYADYSEYVDRMRHPRKYR